MVDENCTCLNRKTTLALPKKSNLKRQFMTRHAEYQDDYPLGSEIRKVEAFRRKLCGQQSNLRKFCVLFKSITLASFKACFVFAKKGKLYSEGELLNERYLEMQMPVSGFS